MDNLTHTLLGALVGETAARYVPTARSVLGEDTRRSLYVTLTIAGSNLPDLDILYAGISGDKLGYLLHHRGHTHTVIGALMLGLLLYALALAWLRWRSIRHEQQDRWWLAAVALFAPLLHIAMDATNEYGVHPFWPFDNAWYYGDSIFIIEPLFWAAAAPLVFLFRTAIPRVFAGLALVAGVGLAFGSGLVPPVLATALTLLALGMLLIGWRCSARVAAIAGVVASCGILLLFTTTGQIARSRAEAQFTAQYPRATALDFVLAPLPVNPLCWEVIAMQVDGDEYALRQAMLSLAPGWMPARDCPAMLAPTTVQLSDIDASDSAAFEWMNEATMSRAEAAMLLRDNCEARALGGFVRALWFRESSRGWLIGDLRYDREPGLGFAEMEVSAEPQACPRFVPPWELPRADLLD